MELPEHKTKLDSIHSHDQPPFEEECGLHRFPQGNVRQQQDYAVQRGQHAQAGQGNLHDHLE